MKRKMIREYLKTSFGTVFCTIVLGGLLCFFVLFWEQSADAMLPQYLALYIQNDLSFDQDGLRINQRGLKKLQEQHCWLQVIDAQGNVLGSINADKELPEHYTLYELVDYSLNSGRLNQYTLFVSGMVDYSQ